MGLALQAAQGEGYCLPRAGGGGMVERRDEKSPMGRGRGDGGTKR